MPRPNRNMKRISAFVPAHHMDIVEKLADRKGLNPSDIFRAMLKKYLADEVQKIQEEE